MGKQGHALHLSSNSRGSAVKSFVTKAKWFVGASILTASSYAMAAPPLVINNVTDQPTQVGSFQGKRAIWLNAGSVGGETVDIVAIMTTATLNHNFTTVSNAPTITGNDQDNVFVEWRLYRAGTYDITTNSGGVPVEADAHVQFNDLDGPDNERAFAQVCDGNIKWIRIDKAATTGRAFGIVGGQPDVLSIIGDKTYSSTPESGLEVFYPETSVFRIGRTANNGFNLRLSNPTYSAFDTLDYECADFKPPLATDDSKEGVPGTPTVLNILNNDTLATQNNNAPHNNTLAPSEFAKTSVSLVAPPVATGIVTDASGDVIGFTVPGEGVWAYDDVTGELTFTPDPSFKGYATLIEYTFDNALGVPSNNATVTVWYPAIGVVKSSVFNDTNGDGYGQVGETIDYTYQVNSYGAEALRNITITETGFTGSGSAPVPAYQSGDSNGDNQLDLTETWTFTASYALVAADLTGGSVTNSATGSGQTAAGTPATDTSDSSNPSDGNGAGSSGPGPNNGDPTRTTFSNAPIVATNDTRTGVNGAAGENDVLNVLTGDTINGVAATATNAIVNLNESSSLPTGLIFDTATGNVSVSPGTPLGTYTFDYDICEALNPTNCKTATASVTVALSADLSITKSDGNTAVFNGDIVTYTLTVTNNGPDSSTGAVVKDVIGSGLTCPATNVVTITGNGIPAVSFTVADLTGAGITLATLANGQTATLSYSCGVN